jgi:hypothetical protein
MKADRCQQKGRHNKGSQHACRVSLNIWNEDNPRPSNAARVTNPAQETVDFVLSQGQWKDNASRRNATSVHCSVYPQKPFGAVVSGGRLTFFHVEGAKNEGIRHPYF